jgi:hypothetical protein
MYKKLNMKNIPQNPDYEISNLIREKSLDMLKELDELIENHTIKKEGEWNCNKKKIKEQKIKPLKNE